MRDHRLDFPWRLHPNRTPNQKSAEGDGLHPTVLQPTCVWPSCISETADLQQFPRKKKKKNPQILSSPRMYMYIHTPHRAPYKQTECLGRAPERFGPGPALPWATLSGKHRGDGSDWRSVIRPCVGLWRYQRCSPPCWRLVYQISRETPQQHAGRDTDWKRSGVMHCTSGPSWSWMPDWLADWIPILCNPQPWALKGLPGKTEIF